MNDETLIRDRIARACATISAHTDELSDLDRAIGDGDHGLNMSRGFNAIAALTDEIAGLALGPALQKAGMTLVMKVGGASGPLYGSALLAMGKAAANGAGNGVNLAAMFEAGVEAVKARGKSEAGMKTMLEVLVPVVDALNAGGGIPEIRAAAAGGLEATREMLATKGRAAFLGERSIGHLDPGARSSALLIEAVCDVLEGK